MDRETLVLQTTQAFGSQAQACRAGGRVGQKVLLHLFTHLSVLFPEFRTPDWPNRTELHGYGREDDDRRLLRRCCPGRAWEELISDVEP